MAESKITANNPKLTIGPAVTINDFNVHTAPNDGILRLYFSGGAVGYIYVLIDDIMSFHLSRTIETYTLSYPIPIKRGMTYQITDKLNGRLDYFPYVTST